MADTTTPNGAGAPTCPHCDQPITRALDAPYGFWEWNGERYELRTASQRVDVSPWVHWDCMGELRDFHPQDPVTAPAP
jgi:hypothetical protein